MKDFTVTTHHGAYLLVVGTGEAALSDMLGVVDLAHGVSMTESYRRLLVDLTAVTPRMAFSDHMVLGMHAARVLRHLERVATVVAPAFCTGASQKAAQDTGLVLHTFTDMRQATEWIVGSM